MTHTPPPSSLGVGGFLGLRPLPPTPKKMDLEFKFTVKLKLEFDFDFDLILGSNFTKVVQISTYHFHILNEWVAFRISRMQFWGPKWPPNDKHSNVYHLGGAPSAPGRPRGAADCIYCSGLHPPPGTLGNSWYGSAPGPRPRGDYF